MNSEISSSHLMMRTLQHFIYLFYFILSGFWNGSSKNLNVEFSKSLICLLNGRQNFWMISSKFLWMVCDVVDLEIWM